MKNQLLSGLAVLSMVAFGCSDKAEINEGGDLGKDVKGYLSLEVTSAHTRTAGTPTSPGDDPENKITTVDVVLVGADGKIAVIQTPTFTNGVSAPFEVKTGNYFAYALVNKPANVTLSVNGVLQQVIEAAQINSGLGAGGFFMVNERNSNIEAGVPVSITSSNTIQQPAQVTIRVDRAAVKIEDKTTGSIAMDMTPYDGFFNSVELVGFVPLNVNKEYNLLQHWGKDNGTGDPLDHDVLSTPLYSTSNPPKTRVADQYSYNIGEYTKMEKSSGVVTSLRDLTTADQYSKGPVYTTENRPTIMFYNNNQSLTAGQGETTGVIYRVQTKQAGSNAATFYVYNSQLHANLTEIQKDFVDPLPTDAPSLRAKGIKVYENGVMYYTYFILDPNTEHQYDTEDYYAVMRNSIYNLTVTNLTRLGDDVPGGGSVDPETPGGGTENPPIDSEEAYLKVTLKVNPWILNTINIEF